MSKNLVTQKEEIRMQELLSFIKSEDERLKRHFQYSDHEKRTYARVVKIMEELGELCNEVLSLQKGQRKEKLAIYDSEHLSEEFADVIITTLLLAEHLEIDIENSLKNKIEKIKARNY